MKSYCRAGSIKVTSLDTLQEIVGVHLEDGVITVTIDL